MKFQVDVGQICSDANSSHWEVELAPLLITYPIYDAAGNPYLLGIEIAGCVCVGFIGIGETAVTPAGVASADGVAESRCGAGVEEERDSSDPLSDGGTGRV